VFVVLSKKKEGDITETEVLGRRVYLPNIVLKLVRNNTPPGQPYNPYEATFRIPQSVTKTDVRSLLQAIYGVKVTYIRTDNYISPWYRTVNGFERRSYKTYKRAVVGLVDPFYYPHRLEDMPTDKRKEREEWIEKHFSIQHTRNLQKEELLRMTKGQGRMSWKLNAPFATKKSHIIRLVTERRANREELVTGFVGGMRELREEGKTVDYDKLKAKVLKNHIPPPPEAPSPTPAPTPSSI
jgi:large subunit ribosomal protein L23